MQLKQAMMEHAYLENKIATELKLNYNLDLPHSIPLSLVAGTLVSLYF